MAIELPKDAMKIGENLASFCNDYNGKSYWNICKVYTDRDSGKLCRGKGLTVYIDDFEHLEEAMDDIAKQIAKYKKGPFKGEPANGENPF